MKAIKPAMNNDNINPRNKVFILIALASLVIGIIAWLSQNTPLTDKVFKTIIVPLGVLSALFWFRRDKSTSVNQDRLGKYLVVFLAFSVSFWLIFGSFSIRGVRTNKNLKSVIASIDNALLSTNDDYNDLCKKKRNTQLKEEFVNLQDRIFEIRKNCGLNENLSYKEQSKAEEHLENSLKNYPQLLELEKGNIICW